MFRTCLTFLSALLVACTTAVDNDALPPLVEAKASSARHCGHCGWIESKRELAPSVAQPWAPLVSEYTLHMPDGSRSVFHETHPAAWRVGERVGVIDGVERPPS
jgi:hypothetical protein